MSNIVVITFEDEAEALKARQALKRAQQQGYLELKDAVTLVKGQDGKIKVKDEFDRDAVLGAVGGSLIGLLIAGIFFPIGGLVLGAIGGGMIGKMVGMGVDKKFIREVGEQMQPGSSAIFLVIKEGYLDYLVAVFKPFKGQVLHTSLPEDAEKSLQEVLSKRVGKLDNQMIALGFEGQQAATEMLGQVAKWQERGILRLEDVVVASRGEVAKVEIVQTRTLTGKYAVGGGGVGLLVGLLLGGPVGGLVVGAAAGAIAGKRKDIGIDDHIIKEVSEELRPNTSMLFLMGKCLDPKRLERELSTLDATVITTSLSDEQQDRLKQLLEQDNTGSAGG